MVVGHQTANHQHGPGEVVSSSDDPSSRLTLYAQAVAWCLEGDLDRAQATLFQAYSLVPPLTLTHDDRRVLEGLADNLVYIGQLLPSIQPTLELLQQLQGTCAARAFHAPL